MLWLLLVLVGWTANVSQSADVSQSIFTELSHLPLDENDRLEQHYLLHSDNLECSAAITDRISRNEFLVRRVAPVGGKLATLYFGQTSSPCSAVCLTRGTHISSLGDPLPQHLYAGGDLDEWISKKCQRVEIGFILYAAEEAETYWVNSSGELHLVGSFLAGERNTAWHTTYLGHKFEIHEKGTGKLLGRYTAEYDSINPVGVRAENLFARDVTSLVKNTFDMEWRRAHTVQRTFTEFGFDKGRLPSDLWGSMSAFYYNNRHNKCSEEWEGKGVFVNWWESSVYFIPMPWGLKRYWQSRLKDLVEAWSGVELELTDIYGMRRYEDGARLLTHVDREATHAASLIINVAQGKMRKPWNVEIYDFADRLHEITMDEGDIVYYESARCLHGRMQPLEGDFYVNLFAHYRPVGDPQWYLKPNPADTPKQALDLGTCSSNGTAVSCSKTEYHAPYLSPKMSKLEGAKDLFEFWRDTAPGQQSSSNEEL